MGGPASGDAFQGHVFESELGIETLDEVGSDGQEHAGQHHGNGQQPLEGRADVES